MYIQGKSKRVSDDSCWLLSSPQSSPLPPGSLRAVEQQLVATTLEKEAIERVLLQEQAEVRMLQQELGVMAHVATALEETQAQLQVRPRGSLSQCPPGGKA